MECDHRITRVEEVMAEKLNMNPYEVHLILDLFDEVSTDVWVGKYGLADES